MHRTKFPALEAANTQMQTGWLSFALHEFKHAHGTEIDAESAPIAEDTIDKHIHKDRW